jgi:hypothetical protein
MLPLNESLLNKHREKTGIEGTWQAYFSMLNQALDTKSLTFEMEEGKKGEELGFILRVHYPLMPGAKITGTFELTSYEVRGRERHVKLR